MKFKTTINDIDMTMDFTLDGQNLMLSPKEDAEIDFIQLSSNTYSLLLNGKSHYISISKTIDVYIISIDHISYLVKVEDKFDVLLQKIGIDDTNTSKLGEIHALIPGLVSQLFVNKGDNVTIGQKLIILEAMKMENEIDSPISGIIKNIYIYPGDKVNKGELIMEISN